MMSKPKLTAICVLAASVAALVGAQTTTTAPASKPAAATPASSYDGFSRDVELLRDVYEWPAGEGGKKVRGSTPEAQQAAQRIFRNVGFLHRSRDEVLQMLGDPKTISDYGRPDAGGESDPLVYVFDSGLGGSMYTLTFAGGRCVAVRVEGLA